MTWPAYPDGIVCITFAVSGKVKVGAASPGCGHAIATAGRKTSKASRIIAVLM